MANHNFRTLIETTHLVKRYGDKLAVNDVSFTVDAGEIFGFLGPNGAGKTTTLKMIVGLLEPSSGSVKVDSFDVKTQPIQAKSISGYVPDEPNLYAKLSGNELLRFVGDLYDLDQVHIRRRIDELLRLFDLFEVRDDLVESYSHGMQQKISLAAALMHDPKILVLDEPTVGLDPKSARLIKDILRQFADRGAAVMLSTHILEIAERMCDRIGIINKGQLVAVGNMNDLRALGGSQGGMSLEDIFLELTGGAEYAEIAEVLKVNKDGLSGTSNSLANSAISGSPNLIGRQFTIWHYIWKLFRLQMVLTMSGLRRSKTRRKIGIAIIALFILTLAGLLFWGSWALLRLLKSPVVTQFTDPTALLNSMPTAIISFAFIAILLTNFGVLLQSLYLAKDMDFLLSAPLPMRAVFFTKMLQAILPNFGLVCLFGLPVLFGLGASGNYSFIYFPLVVVAMALLTLAAGGISSMLVMVIARFIPARRVAEVLGFVGVLISVIFSQTGRFISDINFSNSQISTGFNTLLQVNSPLSPLAWIGRGLVAIGAGQYLIGSGLLAISFGMFAGIFWLALVGAERLYYTGWASLQGSPRKKKQRTSQAVQVGSVIPERRVERPVENFMVETVTVKKRSFSLLPAPYKAVVHKDFLLVRRDLRNLSQLITPLIIGVLVIVSMTRTTGSEGSPLSGSLVDLGGNISFYTSMGFTLFVGWSLMFSLTMSAFSREGRNYWLLKVSPISTRDLLLAKFTISFIPSLIFELILLGIIMVLQHVNVGMFFIGVVVAALYVAGGIGINLMFGIIGARLDWQDPRRMNSTSMGCIASIVSFIYLPLSIAFFFLPPIGFSLLKMNSTVGELIGLVLGGCFCLACAIVPPLVVRKRIDRIGSK